MSLMRRMLHPEKVVPSVDEVRERLATPDTLVELIRGFARNYGAEEIDHGKLQWGESPLGESSLFWEDPEGVAPTLLQIHKPDRHISGNWTPAGMYSSHITDLGFIIGQRDPALADQAIVMGRIDGGELQQLGTSAFVGIEVLFKEAEERSRGGRLGRALRRLTSREPDMWDRVDKHLVDEAVVTAEARDRDLDAADEAARERQ